jgi:putative chitinase
MIKIDQLIACGIPPERASAFIDPLNQAFDRFGIQGRISVAGFIAQAAHESENFTRLEENLNYSKPERIMAVFPSSVPSIEIAARLIRNPEGLANRVYANRLGNGDESSGDGWAFRGRGLFQLTGRLNYAAAGGALDIDLTLKPDLVAKPGCAALTAGWFWAASGCNSLTDIDAITRKINGRAMLGAVGRRVRFERALKATP